MAELKIFEYVKEVGENSEATASTLQTRPRRNISPLSTARSRRCSRSSGTATA